ncbi:MAG: 16S rRNA (guanine(966)-N(2))-methyltransferase RsmD [Bacteroidia bacterium]
MIRIISGKWRGKKIQAPESLPVRPTTDRAKESLFNWLSFRINFEGIKVLDLFAGTGNISYEFISRGAEKVYAVDADARCADFVRKNFKLLKAENSIVRKLNLPAGLTEFAGPFDIIFADPPYNFENYAGLIESVTSGTLMGETSIFIVEHDGSLKPENNPYFMETRKYGKVHFTYFTKNMEE